MIKKILIVSLILTAGALFADRPSSDCTLKGKKLYGKVKIVDSFPDLKVQIVDSFPDIKIQFVTSFPDLKIKYVDSFPGL